MSSDSNDSAASEAGAGRRALRTLAHDLGNLASRLTMLSANLQAQIPDPAGRSDAVALLEDTARRLREVITGIREVERGL